VAGPADGGRYYFGNVPAAPGCDASDAVSGVDGACQVQGYGTTVGSHTVKATAKNAGNVGQSGSRTYTVLPWTVSGFYAPVDLSGVDHTVKGGSTVPPEVRAVRRDDRADQHRGRGQLHDEEGHLHGCAPQDAIEMVTTGRTSLRYDTTAGQFIQKWKTPTGAGTCYAATMTTADGSSVTAFKKK
jgi:hypothetical protein